MSKVDAGRAMKVYTTFTRQTDYVVQYLSIARQYEHQTRVEVPKLKHAPVNLGRQLEEYLNDPDFEVHRRQYLAELDAKKGGGSGGGSSSNVLTSDAGKGSSASRGASATAGAAKSAPSSSKPVERKAGGDLIDFFGALDSSPAQAPAPQLQMIPTGVTPWGHGMFQPQQVNMFQPTGFQPTNPFQMQATGAAYGQPQQAQQLQPAYTGVGFGGFTQQQQQPSPFQPTSLAPIPQNSIAPFPQQQPTAQVAMAPQQQIAMPTGQVTNPFRQTMLMTNPTGMAAANTPSPLVAQPTSTNPFTRTSPQASQPFGAPNGANAGGPATAPTTPAALVPMKTGTNPFARDYGGPEAVRPHTAGGIVASPAPAASTAPLMPQQTGSTNPFRQSAFINQTTGMGWQHSQPTGGLLGQLETVPVFPRPAPQTPWS